MHQPINQAAHLIVAAQSIITDLTAQAAEIQAAIGKQQALIDSLITVAEWFEDPPVEPISDPDPAE